MSLLSYGLELVGWGTTHSHAAQEKDQQRSAFQRSPSLFPIPDGSSNPPSWQLDHLPSAPPPPLSPFAAVPIPIPEVEQEAIEVPNKESLEAAVADFNGSLMASFLESPSPESRARIPELKGGGLTLGVDSTGVFLQESQVEEETQDGNETDSEHGRDGSDDDEPFELSSDSEADELQITHIAPSSLSSHLAPLSYARSPSRSPSPPPRPEPVPLPPPPMRSFAPPPPPHSVPLAFIPALTRPRGAHLSKAYENESDLRLDDPDSSDDPNALPPLSLPTRTRKATKRRSPPNEPPRGRSRSSLPSVRRSTSSVSASSSTLAAPSSSLKRTEQPAVEDDPSIRPYGCCYPSCIERNRRRALRPPNDVDGDDGDGDGDGDEQPTSWRTIREMREHCAAHKKAGEVAGETPFRCALDPCGKTFKSAAGLLWHFTSASAGHFFVSREAGEDRPTKKFKAEVEASGRSEACPIPGCSKAFKQAAGLAYHLAHTANHPAQVTEALIEGFGVTLQSKTRWWFRKLGLKIRGGGDVGGADVEESDSDGEDD